MWNQTFKLNTSYHFYYYMNLECRYKYIVQQYPLVYENVCTWHHCFLVHLIYILNLFSYVYRINDLKLLKILHKYNILTYKYRPIPERVFSCPVSHSVNNVQNALQRQTSPAIYDGTICIFTYLRIGYALSSEIIYSNRMTDHIGVRAFNVIKFFGKKYTQKTLT